MKKRLNFALIVCFQLSSLGCAVGNKYDYGNHDIALPIKGSGAVGLAVIDDREYVVSGSKSSDFVGLQRGGFGNPFNVTTISGRPLAVDFATSLENALSKNGFTVKNLHLSSPDLSVNADVMTRDGSSKNIVLTINEWKTDAMMNLRLIYDLELSIVDKQGNLLGRTSDRGDEVITGAGFQSSNSQNAASAFETKVGRLFNKPEISNILNN